MGIEEEIITFMKAVIRCSTVTGNVRNGLLPRLLPEGPEPVAGRVEKEELANALCQIIQSAHVMDLNRCLHVDVENFGRGNIHIQSLLLRENGVQAVQELLDFSQRAQEATGDYGARFRQGEEMPAGMYLEADRYSPDFALLSNEGGLCWERLQMLQLVPENFYQR